MLVERWNRFGLAATGGGAFFNVGLTGFRATRGGRLRVSAGGWYDGRLLGGFFRLIVSVSRRASNSSDML